MKKMYSNGITGFSNYTALLQDQRFLRTHRSYIVNMDYINKVKEESFQLDDGCEIPMRRRDRGELKKSFYSYMLYKTRQGIAR